MSRQNPIPQIGISRIEEDYLPPSFDPAPWYRSRRFVIFVLTFLLSITLTLGYVYSRPAIYQSIATLLTVAKTAIDEASREADIQHVAIQKQVLMGAALLAEISKRVQAYEAFSNEVNLTVADIRQILDVRLVLDTNLVELVAEGPDPEVLPILINTWIDVYLAARAQAVSQSTDETVQVIQGELDGLEEKINAKRGELDIFRQNYDITSAGREENEALARLAGLNESVNTANEEEVKAKARLDSINKAVARGQAVVPKEDTRTLSLLEQRAQELREELDELDRNYTRDFMALSPALKVIPEKLAALEKEIERMRQAGQNIVLSEAQQEYNAAKQATQDIQGQLNKHKKKATEFTTRFAQHDALQLNLEELELRFRETQARLAQIEARFTEKYPQVEVVDRAFKPRDPIRPMYTQDALLAVVGSALFALLCVWVVEYLTRKAPTSPSINISGFPVYHDDVTRDAISSPLHQKAMLTQRQNIALSHSPTRELLLQEVDVLLHTAHEKDKLLMTLLLSGVTLDEISVMQPEQFDFEKETLTITGLSPRTITLHPILHALLSNPACQLIDSTGQPLEHDDLAALLACTVVDAGLSVPEEITAISFQHTYIIYLVRQGIRLADLKLIVGYLTPTELSSYSIYSPPGPGRSFKDIDLLYPALASAPST
tara:strand:+ start:126 stop:2114 length:1989 start_codon:yes stop_codon:yes gene_type:complete